MTSEPAGRAGRTLPHPVDGLRQTVIALRAGAELGEHESPGPASVLVLRGRVRVVAGETSVSLAAHHVSPVPDRRHSLLAEEDSVVLLSVAIPVPRRRCGLTGRHWCVRPDDPSRRTGPTSRTCRRDRRVTGRPGPDGSRFPASTWGSVSGGAMSDAVLTALAVGGAGGGYLGYQLGNWMAASRAARATYRTQRNLRR